MPVRVALFIFVALVAACPGCRQGGRPGTEPILPVVPAVYPALSGAWPAAVPSGSIGRGAVLARATPAVITGPVASPPIVVERVWAVPGASDAPARAIVSGTLGDGRAAVELVLVDGGRIRWRDADQCTGPVVHVTEQIIVCADAVQMVGLDVASGELRWRQALTFAGAEGGLIVATLEGSGTIAVVEVATGTVVSQAAPPEGVPVEAVQRACAIPDGVEVWAWTGGLLARYVVGGASAGPAETMTVARPIARVDACGEPALLELAIPDSPERDLLAIARAPLAVQGGPITERGFWRDGDLVITATARGIEKRSPALEWLALLSDAQVGRSLDARGSRRLVRGAAGRPVLLEDNVPVAWLSAPAHADSAVLGDRHVVGGGWQGPAHTLADRPARWLLPVVTGPVRVPPILARPNPDPPIHARDLPVETAVPDVGSLDLPDAGHYTVGGVFVDPADPAILYAAPLEQRPDATRGAGLAALDLRARVWRWHAPEGCPPGMPVTVAVARDVVVCGSRASVRGFGAVRAISRTDGAIRWTWTGDTVDALAAGGGLVIVTVGRLAQILDASSGARLATIAADDGFAPRAVALSRDGVDVVVTVERGAVVARLPRAGMLPLWATSVRGAVLDLSTAGDRVIAELAEGELYVLDGGGGPAVAAAGWASRWRAVSGGELVLAEPALPAGPEWQLLGYGVDGAPRFTAALAVDPPWLVGARGRDPAALLALAYGPAARAVAILDPASGLVRARVTLPARAIAGGAFATVVDGTPVAGAILAQPLGVVIF